MLPSPDAGVLWTIVDPEEAAHTLSLPPAEWFGPAEQEALAALQTPWRRREWCAGRMAVKRIVARWLQEARGLTVLPPAVTVTQDGHGAPHVVLPAGVEAPAVSIAHSDGYGFAALLPPGEGGRIGVDIERVRDLNPRLVARLCAPGEEASATVQPPGVTPLDGVTLWTLKEATLKALGVGLRLPMRCLWAEVTARGCARIHRAPGPPDVDNHVVRPWSATGAHARWNGFALAIVTVRYDGRPTTDDRPPTTDHRLRVEGRF